MAFVKYHDELKKSICNHRGKTLHTFEINRIFQEAYPSCDIRFMQPSDHCVNRTNKGACKCSMTAEALFERIERGKFRVR